ncbi:SCO family protein [Pelistega suis]|uniref:SCO family protein n=1 Tax=Pelistega suis TaxID=1631957 RepID=UPI00211BAD32|nr:SCO family protein [Pelistega suis]MCQ9327810.1 SCO family protein [Pelistega suis]
MFRLFVRMFLVISMLAGTQVYARQISFDLENTQGKVTQASYPGKYLLLSLGYTSCPDICPTTLYEYAATLEQLEQPDAIVPIFVTIDPVNDTAETLLSYTEYFDKRIVGLTGAMDNIKALTDQLGATFGYRLDGKRIDIPEKGTAYTVYHTSLIYLINPEGQLVDVFDYQIGADDLAAALNKVLVKK